MFNLLGQSMVHEQLQSRWDTWPENSFPLPVEQLLCGDAPQDTCSSCAL